MIPLKMSWNNIKTIAKFDGAHLQNNIPDEGSFGDFNTTKNVDKNINEITETKPNTLLSLLIESLVQSICDLVSDDADLASTSYEAICKYLKQSNLIDESYSFNEFEEMRGQFKMNIYKIISAAAGRNLLSQMPYMSCKYKTVETCLSRYRSEFEEICFIAGGGYGKVYRAQNKLDSFEYAIKKIFIYSTTITLRHLAEVKTIAILNHPNIVSYKAAWLEPFLYDDSPNQLDESDHESTEAHTHNHTTDKSSDFIKFEKSNNSISFEKSTHQHVSSNSGLRSDDKSTNDGILCRYPKNSIRLYRRRTKMAILYIQMSLCQLTLKDWLKERNACNSFEQYYRQFFRFGPAPRPYDIVYDIFSQILSGLNYIHSKNIVHHDIKPSNIFVDLDHENKMSIKLGDFGLACPLQEEHRGIQLGTPLYAAPEQLKGDCDPKSDIYSLGIVLLELLLKFSTEMERCRTIEEARKGTLPTELNEQSSRLIQSLLSTIEMRPTTKDLLEAIKERNYFHNLSSVLKVHKNTKEQEAEIHLLRRELEFKDKRINELKGLLGEKDMEISRLLQLLNSHNSTVSNDNKVSL